MGLSEGNSGFKWTPPGSTSQKTRTLEFPFHLQPRDRLQIGRRERKWRGESLRGETVETLSVSGGAQEIEGDIRFETDPQGLLNMLKDAADGATITYFPDLDTPDNDYPARLVDVSDAVGVEEDADRFALGEYMATIRLRHAEVGHTFTPMFLGDLFPDPSTDTGRFTLSNTDTSFRFEHQGNGRVCIGTTDGVRAGPRGTGRFLLIGTAAIAPSQPPDIGEAAVAGDQWTVTVTASAEVVESAAADDTITASSGTPPSAPTDPTIEIV